MSKMGIKVIGIVDRKNFRIRIIVFCKISNGHKHPE